MSRVKLMGVPWDEQSSFLKGAADAPTHIRSALFSSAHNLYAEDGTDLSDPTLFDVGGDLELSMGLAVHDEIIDGVGTTLRAGYKPLLLGGDHAISFPAISAFAAHYGPVEILHFDAHPDLYDELEGNRYSHACPFARVMEAGLAKRLVQFGIRTMTVHQREQADRFNVEVHEMRRLRLWPVPEFTGPVYLSIDLDVLDPAFAPGVSHHEAGGMSSRQLIDMIQQFKGEVVGADIVEYNPSRDYHGVTAALAAKLVKEVTARMVRPKEQ